MPIEFKDSIDVEGDIKVSQSIIDSNDSAGTSGQVLSSTATGTDWITLPSTGVAWGGITGILSNQTDLQNALNAKQDTLVSGTNIKTVNSTTILGSGNLPVQEVLVSATNIKTVNGSTLLGSGDLVISTTSTWGSITGTLSSQTDLADALDETTLIQTKSIAGIYQLIPSDRNQNLENIEDCTVQIDATNLSAMPVGAQVFFTKKAETLRFSAIGVTLNSVDSLIEMGRINCGASLLKIGNTEYNLIGELV